MGRVWILGEKQEGKTWGPEKEACNLSRVEEMQGEQPVGLVGRTVEEKAGEEKRWGSHLSTKVMEDDRKRESRCWHDGGA